MLVAQVVVVLAVLGGVVFFVLFLFKQHEYLLMCRAERRIKQREAIMVVERVKRDETFFVYQDGYWQNRSANPNIYANGEFVQPTSFEINVWQQHLQMINRPTTVQHVGQLTNNNLQQDITHLFDLVGHYQHFLIVGGTGSGKTTTMNHLVEQLTNKHNQSVVIWLSTHLKKDGDLHNVHPIAKCVQDEWQIETALREFVQLYKKRCKTGIDTPRIIIVADEWSELARDIPGVGLHLRTLSRGTRKYGFHLIVGTHGQNVGDLDLAGHSDVKQDFAQVFLQSHLTKQNKATFQPGKSVHSQIQIDLPGQFTCTSGSPKLLSLPHPNDQLINQVCGNPKCNNTTVDGKMFCEQKYNACKQAFYRLPDTDRLAIKQRMLPR